MTTINNIAGISVATSANNNNQNNNIETIKGMIISGHDGAKDFGSGEYGLTFGFNWGEYNIFVSRTYGMWLVSLYKNYKSEWTSEGRKISYDAQILDRRLGDYARGKRWSMSLAENMAKFILDTIADYESEQSQSDWDEFVQQTEAMQDIVASYQSEFDGYMEDLEKVAESYDHIETKIDAFAAKMIVKKMAQLGRDLLKALGEYSGCEMVEDDGYWLDTTDFDIWTDCSVEIYDFAHIEEFEGLAETLDLVIAESDMPLFSDEDMEYIDFENQDNLDWLMGHNLPTYLIYEVGQFASTYFHYNYCA